MHNPFKKKQTETTESTIQTLSVDEVKALEHKAVEDGMPLSELMERAGKAVADAAEGYLPERGHVTVLAGHGNNGGDGWVAARILADKGYDVIVFSKLHPNDITVLPAGDAAKKAIAHEGVTMILLPDEGMFGIALNDADLIIDAMLGTGFSEKEVKEPYATWIRAANNALYKRDVPIIAIDCPSGLDVQSGHPATDCICAKETITMIAIKDGLVKKEAKLYVGAITLNTLGIEPTAATS